MMPLTPKARRCRNRRRHVDVVEMVKEMDENHNAKLEGERKQKNGKTGKRVYGCARVVA